MLMKIIRVTSSTVRFFRLLGALFIVFALSACGGSDKKAEPVPAPGAAPIVSVTASSAKVLTFSWSAVNYATSYRLLKNEGGTSGYTTVREALSSTTATDSISVHLHDWVNTRYIVEACNQTGCSESVPVYTTEAMLGAIGALRATNPQINDYLGYSVALSGDGEYLAVGATNRDGPSICADSDCSEPTDNAGAVFLFTRKNGVWAQQTEIMIAGGASNANDYFGYTLALSSNGDTLAVGTPFESSGAKGINGERNDASQPDAGAVYVFTRANDTWAEQAYIKASNAEAYDYFGGSVSLSGDGNTLVIGAQGEASKAVGVNGDEEDNSVGVAGAVYVFERSEVTWAQKTYLKASTQVYLSSPCFDPSLIRCLTTNGSRFGSSVSIAEDGNTLVVGAFFEHSNAVGIDAAENNIGAFRSGAAYVFIKIEGGWQQQAYVKASNARAHSNFGYRVALGSAGDILAVSSINDSSQAAGVNGDGSDTSAPSAGAVYLFSRSNDEWSEVAYLKASNASANTEFGSSLALSADGEWLAVGAAKEKSNAAGIGGNQTNEAAAAAGAVYLFKRDGNSWAQHRYIKAPAAVSADNFGFSLALGEDGETLAVGAMGVAAPVPGNNLAANAGAVFIY